MKKLQIQYAIGSCKLNGFSQAQQLLMQHRCIDTDIGRVEVVGETPITLNYTFAKVIFARRIAKSAIGCS